MNGAGGAAGLGSGPELDEGDSFDRPGFNSLAAR